MCDVLALENLCICTLIWFFLPSAPAISLVGGLEHFLFSHILRIIIPIDFHILQRGGPTTNQQGYIFKKCYESYVLRPSGKRHSLLFFENGHRNLVDLPIKGLC